MFRDIDAYSATLTGAQLEGRVDVFAALFCPDFGNNCLGCVLDCVFGDSLIKVS